MTQTHDNIASDTALILIDIQVGAFDGEKIVSIDNPEFFLSNIQALLRMARKNNMMVVYVQDCGEIGGAFEQGTAHWRIHPLIAPTCDELVIHKRHADAFVDTKLAALLRQHGIHALVMCGLHSQHCYRNTCMAALKLGFNVIVPAQGHASCSSDNACAETIIAKQNSDLAAHGAEVVSINTLL